MLIATAKTICWWNCGSLSAGATPSCASTAASCTERVGVSMTGVGERILVKLAAKRLADLVDAGETLDAAAQRVLREVGPGAGLVALAGDGSAVARRNTPFMAVARRP